MHKTRNDLPQVIRAQVIEELGARLADLLDLKLAVKQAHWNVKGPGFLSLHELFDQIAGRIEEHADEVAERLVALGGVALGRSQVVAARTTLPAYPDEVFAGNAHLAALAERIAQVAQGTRAAIDSTGELSDEVTSDLFNAVTGALDKDLWLVEAHLQ